MEEIVVLKSGQAVLEIEPSRGLNTCRWSIAGQELLYVDANSRAENQIKYKGGNPVIFPIFTTLCLDGSGKLLYDGKKISLAQHGIARISKLWKIVHFQDNQIECVLESDEASLKVFPFPFRLTCLFELGEKDLVLTQKVENIGKSALPFSAGWHPYFKVSDPRHSEVTGLPVGTSYDMRTNTGEIELGAHYSGSLALGQREINHHFKLKPSTYRLRDRLTGRDILITPSEGYSCLTVWSLKGEPFVCVEPVTARRGAFQTGEDLIKIQAGEIWEGSVRFEKV